MENSNWSQLSYQDALLDVGGETLEVERNFEFPEPWLSVTKKKKREEEGIEVQRMARVF